MEQYNKNIFKNYKIPLYKIMSIVVFLAVALTLLIIELVSVTTNSDFPRYFDSISDIALFNVTFIAILVGLLFNEFGGGMEAYFVKNWILKNVRCPMCGNLFKKCEYEKRNFSFGLRQSYHLFGHVYSVYCEHCKKEFFLEQVGAFSKILKFMSQSREDEITEKSKKFSNYFRKNEIKCGVLIGSVLSIICVVFLSIVQQNDYQKYAGYVFEEVRWHSKITPGYLILTRAFIVFIFHLVGLSFGLESKKQQVREKSIPVAVFTFGYYAVLFYLLFFYCERFSSDIIVIMFGVITTIGILFYLGMYFILFEGKKKNNPLKIYTI